MHCIVFIGSSVSGKGTQCRRIAKLLGFPTLGTCKLIRDAIESDSALSREVKSYLSRGACARHVDHGPCAGVVGKTH